MFGKTRHQHAYYACQPDPHHHDGRAGWYPAHPASIWVREDTLLDLVRSFFAERILGPGRHDLLRTQLAVRDLRTYNDHARTARQVRLHTLISDIQRRQKNLITRLEQQDDTGDPQTDQEYRQGIQRRFTELAAQHRAHIEELTLLQRRHTRTHPKRPRPATTAPQLPLVFGPARSAPASLYDAFQLQVRYHRPRHEVTIRVTIRADALPSLTQLVKEAAGQPGIPAGNGEPRRRSFPCSGRPRQDSNLRTRLRRPMLYPLSYGGSGRRKITSTRRRPDRRGHGLATPWACCRGN